MKELGLVLGGLFLLIVLLFAGMFWSYQDFADRCERTGGVLLTYEVCVAPGVTVLMTK